MKKIISILYLIGCVLSLQAQAPRVRTVRVYTHSQGKVSLALKAGKEVVHSRVDLEGNEHADVVSLVVPAEDGDHRFLLADIDSIVWPTGQHVVFSGSTVAQPVQAKGLGDATDIVLSKQRRSSFHGDFPGTKGNNNVTFYWSDNDPITLDAGYESRAVVNSSDRTKATFTFDDADLDASSYEVYFPGRTVNIAAEQTQNGANNSEHFTAAGDCGYGEATKGSDGSYSFTLTHAPAYLCFLPHIDYLPSAKITKITLTANSNIAGNYQLSTGGLYDQQIGGSRTITLKLASQHGNGFFIGHYAKTEQDTCAAYMVVAPGSRSYTATYEVMDTLTRISTSYSQTFSVNAQANTVYPITCNIPEELFQSVDLGNNLFWTASDVDALIPNQEGKQYDYDAAEKEVTNHNGWDIPTEKDYDYLINHCTWQRGTYNGQEGFLVTGDDNDHQNPSPHRIFLPMNDATRNYWLKKDTTTTTVKAFALSADKREIVDGKDLGSMYLRLVKRLTNEDRVIPYSGTDTLNLSGFTGKSMTFRLFDHAGPDADYSNNANGYLLIKCPTGYKINVLGDVETESTSYDWLNIYDGTTTNSTQLINAGGTMSINVTTTGNNALLWFRSDGSNVKSGLNLTVAILNASYGYDVKVHNTVGGTITTDVDKAKPLTKITVTSKPDKGYILNYISVACEDSVITYYDDDPRIAGSSTRHYVKSDTVRVNGDDWWQSTATFVMPEGAVTVTPHFVKLDDKELSVNIPYLSTTVIDAASIAHIHDCGRMQFKVYDHAGPDADYSNNANGYLRIEMPEGYKMDIKGSIASESDRDWLDIFDGPATSDTKLVRTGGNASIDEAPTTNNVLLWFRSDGSVVGTGIDLTITLIDTNDKHNIAIDNVAGGHITADKTEANTMEHIELISSPDEGYVLDYITVKCSDTALTGYDDDPRSGSSVRNYVMCDTVRVSNGEWNRVRSSFLMPECDVTVTPHFMKINKNLYVNIPYRSTAIVDAEIVAHLYKSGVKTFKVYDHGGPDANYSNNADGYLLIKCPTGYKINVLGDVETESPSYDWLNIYDGTTTDSTQLINAGGTKSINVTTTGNNALLWFRSDNSNTGKGVDVSVTINP
jgi:phage FluMu protein Com